MEARRLLSTVAATTILKPNVALLPASAAVSGSEGASGVTNPTPASTALTPALLDVAYGINRAWTSGKGETIAIVDAYNDPNIASDLAVFDSMYKLPAASLTVENQYGQTTNLPATDASWSMEIALDVEWAHTAAPGARIILVEANSASLSDLMTAVQTAAKQANVVSMSWGGSEFSGESQFDSAAYFGKPGVTFVAASGDDGAAAGAEWPAVSPDVVSVGGTSLTLNPSWTIASQTAWSASGSFWSGFSGSTGGTSLYEPEPSYQTSTIGNTFTRATPDVASVADPGTGVSVYDSVAGAGQTGWIQLGGTSAGAPLWAGIIADADQARAAVGKAPLSSTQTLNLLYGLYKSGSYYSDFYDVVTGSNFAGGAGWGYDLVTGLGTPYASKIVSASAAYTVTSTTLKPSAAVTTMTASSAKATAHQMPSATIAAAPTAEIPVANLVPQAGSIVQASSDTPPMSPHALATAVAQGAPSAVEPARVAHSIPPTTEYAIPLSTATEREPVMIPSEPNSDLARVNRAAHRPEFATPEIDLALSVWDRAMESQAAASVVLDDSGTQLAPAAGDARAEAGSHPDPLLLISGSIGAWGTWMHGSRQGDERRRFRGLVRLADCVR